LLEGNPAEKVSASAAGRFVVQVGAFADAARAKEARTKLERAGLKTYTTVVETKDGQRTRVRVGPFGDKTDADSAASKIKALDLPAAVLVL
jgi:DedD protein